MKQGIREEIYAAVSRAYIEAARNDRLGTPSIEYLLDRDPLPTEGDENCLRSIWRRVGSFHASAPDASDFNDYSQAFVLFRPMVTCVV